MLLLPLSLLSALPAPTATLSDESTTLAPLVKLASVVLFRLEMSDLLELILLVFVKMLELLDEIFKVLVLILDSTLVKPPRDKVPSMSAFDFIFTELST